MSAKSGIQWTEATWSPTVGCSHISPGCDGCYAARDAAGRLAHLPAYQGLAVRKPGEQAKFTGEVRLLRERLDLPMRWRKPRRIFVDSMSDLFHRDVPAAFVAEVFATMARCPQHTFQVLTKRPLLMAQWTHELGVSEAWWSHDGRKASKGGVYIASADQPWPLPNVWLGTSIENDRYTFRANHLRGAIAAVRFISAEPLLGSLPSLDLSGVDWLIVGAESGPGARPMDNDWVRDLRDRCDAAGVAVFVKQLTGRNGHPIKDLDLFPEDLRIREYPPTHRPTITQPSLL